MERSREQESSLGGYEHEFERSAAELKAAGLAGRVTVTDAQKLQLYALYKQAVDGDCCKPQPSAFKPVERAKWTSWQGLQGMDKTTVKRRYVLLVMEILPSFCMPTESQSATNVDLMAAEGAGNALPPPASVTSVRGRPDAMSSPSHLPPTRRQLAEAKPRVTGSSYALILAQFVAGVAVVGAVLALVLKVVFPAARHVALEYWLDEDAARWDELVTSLAPLLWFALGFLFVVLVRSRVGFHPAFPWKLLSNEIARASASQGRRVGQRKRRRRKQPRAESETDAFLREHGIHVIHEPEDGLSVPRLVLELPSDPDAVEFGDSKSTIRFTVEQTADVYYRKFKEPLPDPASRLLEVITQVEERRLGEYDAVFKRRLLRFRNEAPYLIKRFASADFIEYVEDSLLDKKNRRFYVYVKNKSFPTLGILEDMSVYQAHSTKPHWTELHQFCRVHITSSSLSFFRAKIESFISNFYCENAPDGRRYHAQRIAEEFGPPVDNDQ